MRQVKLTSAAKADFATAFAWYESERPGLGEAFGRAVEAQLSVIARQPELFLAIDERFRRVVVRRYPYVLVYEHDESMLIVHAVFHTSRDPARVRRRIGGNR